MTNLLVETLDMLKANHKSTDDVRWVGSRDGQYAGTWADFEQRANVEYKAYPPKEVYYSRVAADLIIAGDNWWLERHEYDGSEWWEFKTKPVPMENALPIGELIGEETGWTLAEIEAGTRKG